MINGVAGIAALAFLGNLVASGSDFQSELLKNAAMPMIWISWGVVAAVISIGVAGLNVFA